jgi:hypothetical protein
MYMLIQYRDLVRPGEGQPVEFDGDAVVLHRTLEAAEAALNIIGGGKPFAYHQIRIEEVDESPYAAIRQ